MLRKEGRDDENGDSGLWDRRSGLRSESADDRRISELFQAYFNNKMTILIFLIQAKAYEPTPRLLEGIFRFLDDLYHHMMSEKAQEEYRDAIGWLKVFFRTVPEVSPEDREQAKGFVRGFYRAVGMQLKADI